MTSIHPLCASSTDIPADEFEQLKLDIKANGQKLPILLWNGQVIDGRHRLRACEEVGHRPRFDDVSLLVVEEDLPAFVRSCNELRRHETPAQRIEAAIRLGVSVVKSTEIQGAPGAPSLESPKTVEQIATTAKVDVRTVKKFRQVKKNAAEPIQKAMMEGQISIKKASVLAKLPKADQQKLGSIPMMDARASAELKSGRTLGSAAYVGPVAEPTTQQLPEWKAEAVRAIESLYERNKAQWNNPPPPPPRMVIDWVIKIVREL